jgi:ParB family chromosome partitioning protein
MSGMMNFLQDDGIPKKPELAHIPVGAILPNPRQPRQHFDADELAQLADSIREVGVLQPIVVCRQDQGYELVAGERRLRAAKLAGLETIPALIAEVTPSEQQIFALVENIHRSNLSAVEEAQCFRDILDRTGWTQVDAARRVGLSQASLANKLRLLRLDPEVQKLVIEGRLGERQARALVGLPEEEQRSLAKEAVEKNTPADEFEQLAREKGPKGTRRSGRKQNLPFAGPDGPTGELLKELAALVEGNRKKGIPIAWKVKELAQRELVVEITVDLSKRMDSNEERQ